MYRGIVQLVVENSSSPILDTIFDRSQEQDNNQWYSAQSWVGIAEDGEYLQKKVLGQCR